MKANAAYRFGTFVRSMTLALLERVIAISEGSDTRSSDAPESFFLMDPRRGVVGIYPTPEDAQEAQRLMTTTGRQRAIVCDEDGHCLCR